jgi:hypothetical protein
MTVVNTIRRSFSPLAIQQSNVLFGAKSPDCTYLFYKNIFFITHPKQQNFSLTSCQIKINRSDKPYTGFEFVVRETPGSIDSTVDPDDRQILTSHNQPCHAEYSLPFSQKMIEILRSKQITETRAFYEQYSPWEEEQHGQGPIHYSSHWADLFVEIYPMRKPYSSTSELVIQVDNLPIDELQKQGISILQQNASHVLLEDPDGRLVQIMKIVNSR